MPPLTCPRTVFCGTVRQSHTPHGPFSRRRTCELISGECDGAQLDGQTCDSLGYGGGVLVCRPDCRFDISGCEHSCGDGTCEPDRGENSWTCSPDCA